MMTDTTEVDDLVKRATYALEDMQGRVDAGKLAMFADCIDRIESLAAKLAKVEAERDKWYKRAMEMVAERNDARDALPAVYRLALEDAVETLRTKRTHMYTTRYDEFVQTRTRGVVEMADMIEASPTPTAAELISRIKETGQ